MRANRPLLRMLALASALRGRLVLAVVAGALTTAAGVALFAVSGFLLARASRHPGVVGLGVAVVAVRALGISRGVFRYVERLASHDVAFRVLADVRVHVYRRLERLAPAGLGAFRRGDLLARVVSDVDGVQELFVRGVAPPLAALLVGGGAVALAGSLLAPAAGVLAAGLLAAGVGVPLVTAWLGGFAGRRLAGARAALSTDVVDLVHGAPELVAYGAAGRVLDRLDADDALLARLARSTASVQALGSGLSALLSGATVFGLLVLGVAAAGHGSLDREPLAVLVLAGLAAFEVVAPLPAAAVQLATTRDGARRVFEVVDAPDPIAVPEHPVALPEGPYAVHLSDARVRYPGASACALDGVDLELLPGRRVALVGASGSGKTTLVDVLLGFRGLDAGSYSVNGVAAGTLDGDDLRRAVSGVTSDPHVFDTTLRENLLLARRAASDDELVAVLGRVGLGEWYAGLRDGLATMVGVRGGALSGGERQRIALARALLADPPVLVLDEPTAHLDADARAGLMRDILSSTRGRTILLVTHDLEALEGVDEVVVLAQGLVVERGVPHELLRRDGGVLALLSAA